MATDTLLTEFRQRGGPQMLSMLQSMEQAYAKLYGRQAGGERVSRRQDRLLASNAGGVQVLSAEVSRMSGGLQRAARTLMTGNRALDLLSMRLDRASMMMWKFTISAIPLRQIGFYALGAAAGLTAMAVGAVNAAADIDRARRALEAATGSFEKANDVIEYLREQTPKIRYGLRDVLQAGRILTVAGYDVRATLMDMADLAAGVGQEGVTIEHATRAFVDAMHGELRRLRNTFDITREEIERFAVGATDATGQIVDKQRWQYGVLRAIQEKYAGANKSQMEGISGVWVEFMDDITRLAAAFGEVLIPQLAPFIRMAGWIIEKLEALLQLPVIGWVLGLATNVGILTAGFAGAAALAMMFAIQMKGLQAAIQTYYETGTTEGQRIIEAERELLMITQQIAALEAIHATQTLPLMLAQYQEMVALEERRLVLREAAARGAAPDVELLRVATVRLHEARAHRMRVEARFQELALTEKLLDVETEIATITRTAADQRTAAEERVLQTLREQRVELERQRRIAETTAAGYRFGPPGAAAGGAAAGAAGAGAAGGAAAGAAAGAGVGLGGQLWTMVRPMLASLGMLFLTMGKLAIVMGAIAGVSRLLTWATHRHAEAAQRATESLDETSKALERMREIGYDVAEMPESMSRAVDQMQTDMDRLGKGFGVWLERYVTGVGDIAAALAARQEPGKRAPEAIRRRAAERALRRAPYFLEEAEAQARVAEMTAEELENWQFKITELEAAYAELAREMDDFWKDQQKRAKEAGRAREIPGFPPITDIEAYVSEYARLTKQNSSDVQKHLDLIDDEVDRQVALGEMYGEIAESRSEDAAARKVGIKEMKREEKSAKEIAKEHEKVAESLDEAARAQRIATRLTRRLGDAEKHASLAADAHKEAITAVTVVLEDEAIVMGHTVSLLQAMGIETGALTDANRELADTLRDLAAQYRDLNEQEKARKAELAATKAEAAAQAGITKQQATAYGQLASAYEDVGEHMRADEARTRQAITLAQQLGAMQRQHIAQLEAMRDAGVSQDDIARYREFASVQEWILSLQGRRAAAVAAAKPLERQADELERQARYARVVNAEGERAYQLEMAALQLRQRAAGILGDELATQSAIVDAIERRKEYELELAERGVARAEMSRDAMELIGNYKAADAWERKRIRGLRRLVIVQDRYGDVTGQMRTELEALRAEYELQEMQHDRIISRLDTELSLYRTLGLSVARQADKMRELAAAERQRYIEMVRGGRDRQDPVAMQRLLRAVELMGEAESAETDYLRERYSVMGDLYERGVIGEERLAREKKRLMDVTRQQFKEAKEGSTEQLRLWRQWLDLTDDAGTAIDRMVEKVIGAPQEIIDFLSPATIGQPLDGMAAMFGAGGARGAAVNILGRYEHRTLIELTWPDKSPPALEGALDAGIDAFVTTFARTLERG